MSSVLDKNSILFILDKKYRKQDIQITTKTIDMKKAFTIFTYFNYSDHLTLNYFKSFYKWGATSENKLKKLHELLKFNKIDIATYQRSKPEAKKRQPKTSAQNIIKKLTPLLDVFSINKDNLDDALNQIREGTPFSEEAILESYKTLYLLLMQSARGEIVTKKTSISYTLEDNGKGGYTKEISLNSKNEKKMFEETQSHLPDTKSFAMAMVVMEVIERMEQGDKAYATNDELNDLYADYLSGVETEKIAYKGKEYTDEMIDVEVDNEFKSTANNV